MVLCRMVLVVLCRLEFLMVLCRMVLVVLCRLEFLALHSTIHLPQPPDDQLGLHLFHLGWREAFRHLAVSGVSWPVSSLLPCRPRHRRRRPLSAPVQDSSP